MENKKKFPPEREQGFYGPDKNMNRIYKLLKNRIL
jgi:hypothetical protein